MLVFSRRISSSGDCHELLLALVKTHPRESQTPGITRFTCGIWDEATAKAQVFLTNLQILPQAGESIGRDSNIPLEGV